MKVKYSCTACCLRFYFYHREDETVNCSTDIAKDFIERYSEALSVFYPSEREAKVLYIWTNRGKCAEALDLDLFVAQKGKYINTKNSTAVSCNVFSSEDDPLAF